MLNLRSLTTKELWLTADRIRRELKRRQEELRQTCAHPEYVAIMDSGPGPRYRSCKVCHIIVPAPRS